MIAVRYEPSFKVALGAERAIVFCHAEWSLPSCVAQRVVTTWERDWLSLRPDFNIPVFEVRPDEQSFVHAWFVGQGLPHLKDRGEGTLFWLERGQIADTIGFKVSAKELIDRTLKLWAQDAAPPRDS